MPGGSVEDLLKLQDEEDWTAGPRRARYRLCRTAMMFGAIGAGLMVADSLGHLVFMLTFKRPIIFFLMSPGWQWGVGSAIPWSLLLCSFFLVALWPDPQWRRRAGVAMMLCAVGVGYWIWQHAADFGLGNAAESLWLIENLKRSTRWFQIGLLAVLAADVLAQMGDDSATEAKARILSLATAGFVVWALHFLDQTQWNHGWPPRGRGFQTPVGHLILVAMMSLRTMISFAFTVLCLQVGRQCTRALQELAQSDRAEESAFPSPSEAAWDELWGKKSNDRKG